MDAQAAALGVELPDAALRDDDFEVWPEHEQALLLFTRCQTQWRVGSSGVIGLDYNVALSLLALYDVPDRCAVMEDLQVMEQRAVELLNRKADKGGKKKWR